MIEVLQGFPGHVTAFRATGKVTKDDYYNVINPYVKNVATSFGKINYMLILNTELKNYSIGAWIEDGLAGIKVFFQMEKTCHCY